MQIIETDDQKRDRVLADWQAAAAVLAAAKLDEMKKRTLAFPIVFGINAKAGTNRVPLANGWSVKGVRKITYNLEKDTAKVNAVYEAVERLGNEGSFLAARILKRVYDFNEGEYKKLDATNPTHIAVKLAIDAILTTKDGAPTLEIEPPKQAK
jgi:hypothetical protein